MPFPRTYAALLPLALLCAVLLAPAPPARAAGAPLLAWETTLEGFPDTMWGSVPGGYDVMNDLVPTEDGGVVTGGYSIPGGAWPNGEAQAATVWRLDANGSELWRAYLGDGADDYAVGRIRAAGDGGFVVACTAWKPSGAGSGGVYYNVSFVSKLDANGSESWRVSLDPLQMELLGDIDVLPDGSIVGAGRVWGSGGNLTTAALKLSPSGSLLWIDNVAPWSLYTGDVHRMAVTPDGGFYAVTSASLHFYLSRHAPDGSLLWRNEITGLDGPMYYYEKRIDGLTVTADGGCVVAGSAREGNGSYYGPTRPFLVTFDGRGRQSETLVVPTSSLANHAVERLPDGGLLSVEGVAGFGTAPLYVRYDSRGNELWRSTYGSLGRDLHVGAVRRTADGGFAAAGSVPSPGALYLPRDGYVLMVEGDGAGGSLPPAVPEIRIDVLPGSPANAVNPRSKGLLPVALLSSDGFDAAAVDPAAVTLEGAPVARSGRGRLHAVRRDADRDGRTDLLLFFSVPSLRLSPSSTSVTLRGTAPGGLSFSATDALRTVGVPPADRGGLLRRR